MRIANNDTFRVICLASLYVSVRSSYHRQHIRSPTLLKSALTPAIRGRVQGVEPGADTKLVMPYFEVRPTRLETGGSCLRGLGLCVSNEHCTELC